MAIFLQFKKLVVLVLFKLGSVSHIQRRQLLWILKEAWNCSFNACSCFGRQELQSYHFTHLNYHYFAVSSTYSHQTWDPHRHEKQGTGSYHFMSSASLSVKETLAGHLLSRCSLGRQGKPANLVLGYDELKNHFQQAANF